MNNLMQMNYNGNEIRTIDDNGQIWWILKDVCKILDLTDTNRTAERLDNDELTRFKLVSGGQKRDMLCVNESGLYSVILRSDKPEAKPFRRWVTHEVLPEIRRTGRYSLETPKKVKTWYGVPVLTVNDAAEFLNTDRNSARNKIISRMRNGLDFFVLTGYYLQLFKHENRNIPEMATHLMLIKQDEFFKQFNN
ncbi:MAG: hypothetical protein NC320_08745 [Clostridium sp.]|nr:hypothetical protein [Clostridium sp.]